MSGKPLKQPPSRLPWRRHRQELAEARAGNSALWRIITDAHREMDRLDGSWDRSALSLPHRISVYRHEQRLQLKADEMGKTVVWPCNIDAGDGTFHQHSVRPSEDAS